MDQVWAHESYATFIGPLSTTVVVGWDGVRKAWEMRFGQFDRVTISLAESHVRTNGKVGWAVGVEKVELLRKDGETVSFDAFVTNVGGAGRPVAPSVPPSPNVQGGEVARVSLQFWSYQSCIKRFFEHDAGTRTFDRTSTLKGCEGPIQSLAGQAQLARDVLKLTSQVHWRPSGPAFRSR
jgi:hypothetical protein